MSGMPGEPLLKFFQNYAAHGEEIAVRQRRGYRAESWMYGQIAEGANRVAREPEVRGINKGDAVLLWGENSAAWVTAVLACILRGAVVVPIDHASSKEFARRVAGEVSAKLLFCTTAENDCANVPAILLGSLFAITARQDSSPYPSPPLSRQDPLEIIFTSGTTAEPRGVVISHGNVLSNVAPLETEIRKYLKYERWLHPVRFLNLLPLSHVFGQFLGIFLPPLMGGTVVFQETLKPSDVIRTIR